MTDPTELLKLKTEARAQAKLRRAEAAAVVRACRGRSGFGARGRTAGRFPQATVVAGYWPIGTELDVRHTLSHLDLIGFGCALPVVVAKGEPLTFRTWTPQTPMERSGLGILAPAATVARGRCPTCCWCRCWPSTARATGLAMAPAFTTARWSACGGRSRVTAVGIGFAAQEVDGVPRDQYDQPLDWLVTERSR